MYQDSDYLAKRIAEETVNRQKHEHNKAKIKKNRFILTGTCIVYALIGGFAVKEMAVIGTLLIIITAIYWIYTTIWIKKNK